METTNTLKACVSISAIVGGSSLGVVALFAIFAASQLPAAAWVVLPLCLMGTALGYLAVGRQGAHSSTTHP